MSKNYSPYQNKLNSFFDFSKVEPSHFSVELLKKSKKLILDTKQYSKYTFYKLTTIHSFKLPGITDYPLRKNEKIIPIKEYNKMITFDKINLFSPKKKNISEKKSRNINKTSFSKFLFFSNDNSINSKSFLLYIDKFNNMDSAIHKYITYRKNYFVNRNKDGNKKLLEQYTIDNYYNDLTFNLFEDNPIVKKENIFKIKNTEIKLKCDSLNLYFFDEKGKKNSKIKFPFNLMPFFYGINFILLNYYFFLLLIIITKKIILN